jgi:hypothetical protein
VIVLRLLGFPFVVALVLILVVLMTLAAAFGWLASGDPYEVKVSYPRWKL